MKFNLYPEIISIDPNDKFLVYHSNAVKTIKQSNVGNWKSVIVSGAGESLTPVNVTANIFNFFDTGWIWIDRNADPTQSSFGVATFIHGLAGAYDVVGGTFSAHAEGTFASGTIWGIALEAWTGNSTTEGNNSNFLVGCESAVLSQYHNSNLPCIGYNAVFKNRPDGVTNVLHGSIGNNNFNYGSRAILISSGSDAGRSSSGEYCGWQTGIHFNPKSLDRSNGLDYSVIIDYSECTVDNNGDNPWILRWIDGTNQMGMRYNTTSHYIEFYKNLEGSPVRTGYLDMAGTDHAM